MLIDSIGTEKRIGCTLMLTMVQGFEQHKKRTNGYLKIVHTVAINREVTLTYSMGIGKFECLPSEGSFLLHNENDIVTEIL